MCVFESQIHNLLLLWMVMYKWDFCEAWSMSSFVVADLKVQKLLGLRFNFFC